jgi:hypothetical protein
MNSRRLRLWLAVLIFLFALGMIIISFLPSPRIQQVLPVPPLILPTGTPIGWIIFVGII